MFEKLSVVGAGINLLDTLPKIFDGTITEIVQDEAFVTYSPNITREQEQINWTKEAKWWIALSVAYVLGQLHLL